MTLAAIPQAPGCFLRPAQFEDELFLFTLFAESQQQLAFLQSDERLWQSLVEMQHRGRKLSSTQLRSLRLRIQSSVWTRVLMPVHPSDAFS
jgi:hypothetical protein